MDYVWNKPGWWWWLDRRSDVNKATTPKALKAKATALKAKATTPKAKAKATYLKAKNTTTFRQHLYQTINVLRSNLQS